MKKKIVFGYWFYSLGMFVGVGLGITIIIIMSYWLRFTANPSIEQYNSAIISLIISVVVTIFFIITGCLFLFQFTVISEEGIKTRAIWRTIRSLKWEEVKEVRYENFYVSVSGGFTSGWFLIDDGVERKQANGLVRKNSHITVRATKRARRVIEQFWHGIIIEKEIKG